MDTVQPQFDALGTGGNVITARTLDVATLPLPDDHSLPTHHQATVLCAHDHGGKFVGALTKDRAIQLLDMMLHVFHMC
jgi:hypothetical protein